MRPRAAPRRSRTADDARASATGRDPWRRTYSGSSRPSRRVPILSRVAPLPRLADTSVQRLSGVGPKTLDALASMGIENVLDLLTHYPRRYIDRTNQASIADLVPGEEAMVL